MKEGLDLFALYVSEKELTLGPVSERTGLEEHMFPSYADWKVEYAMEYADNDGSYVEVPLDDVDEFINAVIQSAEAEMKGNVDLSKTFGIIDAEANETSFKRKKERNIMKKESNATTTVKPVATAQKPVQATVAVPATAGATTVAKPAVAKTGPAPITKASVARTIFATLSATGTARKDIIASFVKDADLTQAGASTYYQKFKKAADSANLAAGTVAVAAAPAADEGDVAAAPVAEVAADNGESGSTETTV